MCHRSQNKLSDLCDCDFLIEGQIFGKRLSGHCLPPLQLKKTYVLTSTVKYIAVCVICQTDLCCRGHKIKISQRRKNSLNLLTENIFKLKA
jgi:hypothetical protein